jgi:cytochrome P450
MTDVELRDELITLLTAGHETSATALAWTVERLLRTPHAHERLLADLDDDEYLEAVVKESLRVRPVVIDVARVAKRDIAVDGWQIPAGTIVVPAIALVQLRPDVYSAPREFRPERFLGDDQAPSYSWIPFGGGVRRCIGAAFAQFEIKTVLRTVLGMVRMSAPDPAPERQLSRHVTLVPAKEATVVVEHRLAAVDNRSISALSAQA